MAWGFKCGVIKIIMIQIIKMIKTKINILSKSYKQLNLKWILKRILIQIASLAGPGPSHIFEAAFIFDVVFILEVVF